MTATNQQYAENELRQEFDYQAKLLGYIIIFVLLTLFSSLATLIVLATKVVR